MIVIKSRQAGKAQFRSTPQRSLIHRILKEDGGHPSADTIYRRAREELPTVSFKTVYNALGTLAFQGKIRELVVDGKRKRYCPDPRPHHHIVCTGCGDIADVHWDPGITLPPHMAAGYRISRSELIFFGVCPRCRDIVTDEAADQEE